MSWFTVKPTPYAKVDKRSTQLYFAYGSNLNKRQMKGRCPDSVEFDQAILLDHKLIFRGVADIVQAPGRFVEGALYKISDRDLRNLDNYEGFPRLYTCKTIQVYTKDHGFVEAFVYVMVEGTSRYRIDLPYQGYYDTIEEGFKDWKLDLENLRRAKRQTSDLLRTKEYHKEIQRLQKLRSDI